MILIAALSFLVWFIDPFLQYHPPFGNIKITEHDQAYQNIGFIKNMDYETALIGSSMTENFRVSHVNQIFETTSVKICKSGSYSSDIALLIEKTANEGKASDIILGYDTNILRKPCDEYRSALPEYLYNSNPFDDVYYLLNKSIIFDKCYITVTNDEDSVDEFYLKADDEFSTENAINNYKREGSWGRDDVSDIVGKNIDNVYQVVSEHPEISFKIFLPPYSILFWDRVDYLGLVEQEVGYHKDLVEKFIGLENVKLYYFINDYEIITDLDNYRDAGHYSPEVCDKLLRSMKNDEYLLTKDNYEIVLRNTQEYFEEYPYEDLFED